MTEIGLNIKQQFVNPASNDKKEENVQETEQETAQVAEIPAGNAPVANDQEVTSQDAAKALATYAMSATPQSAKTPKSLKEIEAEEALERATDKYRAARKAFEEIIKCDTDDDGKITLADYRKLLMSSALGDVNHDGAVDENDVKIMQQYIGQSVQEARNTYAEAYADFQFALKKGEQISFEEMWNNRYSTASVETKEFMDKKESQILQGRKVATDVLEFLGLEDKGDVESAVTMYTGSYKNGALQPTATMFVDRVINSQINCQTERSDYAIKQLSGNSKLFFDKGDDLMFVFDQGMSISLVDENGISVSGFGSNPDGQTYVDTARVKVDSDGGIYVNDMYIGSSDDLHLVVNMPVNSSANHVNMYFKADNPITI